MNLKEKYSELISLSQLYILNECQLKEKVFADHDTFHFFKNWVKNSKQTNQKENSSPRLASAPTKYTTNSSLAALSTNETIKTETTLEISEERNPKNVQVSSIQQKEPFKEPQQKKANLNQKENQSSKRENESITISPIKSFDLYPLPPFDQNELLSLKNTVRKFLPPHSFLDEIPSDQEAKSKKKLWDEDNNIPTIAILSFNDQEKHLSFLNNLAKAISIVLAPCRVIQASILEEKKKWDLFLKAAELKAVIASDYGLYLLPELMKFYREIPKTAKHLLHETPLLLLSDISLYLKEPQLKPLLWRSICTEFELAKRKKI